MSRTGREQPPIARGVRDIRLAQRIWLQDGGTPVFGVGIRELLIRVEDTGSLHRAASEMGLAYSKAWRIVRRAEEHLGYPLLARRAGGTGGGGSVLSPEARRLVPAFGELIDEARSMLDELTARHLGGLIPEGSEVPHADARGAAGSSQS
jgi:molybdate transport system regulatory protein